MIFSKGGSDLADQIELDQKTAEENTDNYNYTTEEDTSSSSSVNTDELNTYQDINSVTMADDSTCTIVIKQKGMDESGQVGYVAEVTNNSSDTISLYSRYQKSSVDGVTHELWTINASAMEPGESRTAFFYFDDLTSISDLVNVKLSITPYVDDTLEDITTYEVTIP